MTPIKENPAHSGGQQHGAVLTGRYCDAFAFLSIILGDHQLLSVDDLCPFKSELSFHLVGPWSCWQHGSEAMTFICEPQPGCVSLSQIPEMISLGGKKKVTLDS